MPTVGATEQTAEPTLYATSLMDSLIYSESIRWAEGARDRKGVRTGEEGRTPLPPPELGSAEPRRVSLARPQHERACEWIFLRYFRIPISRGGSSEKKLYREYINEILIRTLFVYAYNKLLCIQPE